MFTYDIWQDYVKPRPAGRVLPAGRAGWSRSGHVCSAIGTAFIAAGSQNIMDYIQALFSFFNAPLFATFIVGMFWKRMTPTAGWVGLLAGTFTAMFVYAVTDPSSASTAGAPRSGRQLPRRGPRVRGRRRRDCRGQLVTRPKPDSELVGLVYSLTPKKDRAHSTTGADAGWYRSPALLGAGVLALTTVLYILFG